MTSSMHKLCAKTAAELVFLYYSPRPRPLIGLYKKKEFFLYRKSKTAKLG